MGLGWKVSAYFRHSNQGEGGRQLSYIKGQLYTFQSLEFHVGLGKWTLLAQGRVWWWLGWLNVVAHFGLGWGLFSWFCWFLGSNATSLGVGCYWFSKVSCCCCYLVQGMTTLHEGVNCVLSVSWVSLWFRERSVVDSRSSMSSVGINWCRFSPWFRLWLVRLMLLVLGSDATSLAR